MCVSTSSFERFAMVISVVPLFTLAAAMTTCPSITGTVSTVPSLGAMTFVLRSLSSTICSLRCALSRASSARARIPRMRLSKTSRLISFRSKSSRGALKVRVRFLHRELRALDLGEHALLFREQIAVIDLHQQLRPPSPSPGSTCSALSLPPTSGFTSS